MSDRTVHVIGAGVKCSPPPIPLTIASIASIDIMQWCLPCIRQQAGSRDSAVLPSANSGAICGKQNISSNGMDIDRRTEGGSRTVAHPRFSV